MKSTGCACGFLLLTMAAVASARNAREYFQLAGFQHSPVIPEDALIFLTALAPPLICEPEKGGDWVGGDAIEANYRLILPDGYTDYVCSFEGNATRLSNLNLLQESVPSVFTWKGSGIIKINRINMYCTNDSQLPDEYFHMTVQRPHEELPVKCRLHGKGLTLYVRFPEYPTIFCEIFRPDTKRHYLFNLPGIADDPFKCAFRVYSELSLVDAHAEERLHRSLLSGFPRCSADAPPRFVCFRHATSNGTTHFQLRLPGGSIYDCSFSGDQGSLLLTLRNIPPEEKRQPALALQQMNSDDSKAV